uniref:Endo/exonuclease/phosphatase domain-containing protein n=1 Tax=Haemonchus contortus TaxID=6289 RepID=A0A7I4Y906_HAECO
MEPPSFVVKRFPRETSGVGFDVHPSVVHPVDSDEDLLLRFAILRLQHKVISIVNTYSPHSTAEKVELDAFHDRLEKNIHNEKFFYKPVVGDFNARLSKAQEEEFRIGKLGMGDGNENGNSLAGLLFAARLFHANSLLQEN